MENLLDVLSRERENLEKQRLNALSVADQAAGAIALIDSLTARFSQDSLSLQEFAEAIAGPGAKAEIHKMNGKDHDG